MAGGAWAMGSAGGAGFCWASFFSVAMATTSPPAGDGALAAAATLFSRSPTPMAAVRSGSSAGLSSSSGTSKASRELGAGPCLYT